MIKTWLFGKSRALKNGRREQTKKPSIQKVAVIEVLNLFFEKPHYSYLFEIDTNIMLIDQILYDLA